MPNWKKVITSGSNAVLNEITASGAVSASTYYGDGSNLTGISGGSTDTGSLLTTASVSSNTITFTKGDSSTFDITVDTGSAGSDPFPYTGSAAISGSLSIQSNQDDALTIGGNIDNTAPSFIKFTNGGNGTNTGASIEFPWGQLIRAVYQDGSGTGFRFYDKNQTDSVVLNSNTLSFGKAGGGITFSGNSSTATIQNPDGLSSVIKYKVGGYHSFESYNGSYFEVARIDNQGIDVTGAVSASTYYGDGSNLTGIDSGSWDGIFTGSAVISGSLEVIGNVTGSLTIEGSGSTLFEVNGSEGQLFSITDSLSGSLFAVSDVSGLPILEVFSDDTVKMGSFNNEAIIVTGSTAIASGSFSGSFQGDGSNLTGIDTDPFPYTGSAVISGSLEVIGDTTTNGSTTITGSNSLAGNYALKVANSSGTDLIKAENDGTIELNNKVFVNGTNINYSTSAYALNVSESVNIRGVINFDNSSHQAWIKTANSTQRSIKIPGTGGHGYFAFYNTIGNGIQILNSSQGNATLTLRTSNVDGSNALMGISQGSSLGNGGGYFIYYDSTSNQRLYTFGNPGSENVSNEDGTSVRITASPAGTIGTRNGGNVYIVSTTANGGSDGKVYITGSTELTGSLNVTGNITGSNITASTAVYSPTGSFSYLTGNSPLVIENTDGITIRSSVLNEVNGTKIQEVTQASDLPTTLADNTTYLVRGNVTIPGGSEVTAGQFSAIMGLDRDKDKLTYSGTGNFITVTDETFLMQNLGISSTNASSCILSASNVAASGYNNSRDEFLSIINCQFRNVAGNVMDVKGFDLVDFNNTTFFYCESPDFGCKFQDVSKLEISSCEFIRWFDETSIPTPSGYATCPMIELDVNNHASFGAVNISGCIIHPQQTQFAILVNSGSTTGFGTIAANAFVNVGLTTGGILGQSTYDSGSMLKYDVFGNQGLENSSAEAFITVTGNTTTTILGRGNAVQVDFGANENVRSIQRFGFDTVNEYITYKGSKDIKVLIAGTLVGEKAGGGSETYTLDLRRDSGGGFTTIPGSSTEFTTSGGTVSVTKNLIINLSQNDNLAFYVSSAGGDDFTAQDLQLTITEV